MKTKKDVTVRETHGTEAGVLAGEFVGAIVGSAAGPAGTIAGVVVGAVIGGLSGHVLHDEKQRAWKHDAELDEEIGVTGADLGAAPANAPPARIGAPSVASCGVGSSGGSPAEGPIQDIDQDG
jgi:phage tail tape-measure protein